MPQLPTSGQHVAVVAADPIIQMFSEPRDFGFAFQCRLDIHRLEGLFPLLNAAYFPRVMITPASQGNMASPT